MPASDWLLTPQGAAVHGPSRTAVIADVHLGYEWARRGQGDAVPAHSLAESIERLDRLLTLHSVEHLIVAGDLVESFVPEAATLRDVRRLAEWLDSRSVRLTVVRGNHDASLRATSGLEIVDRIEVTDWTIIHGHRPNGAARCVLGHFHPRLTLSDAVGASLGAGCFLTGPDVIVLPAFSSNAAGVGVWTLAASAEFRRSLPAGTDPRDLQVHVPAGAEVLAFGSLRDLSHRLARSR